MAPADVDLSAPGDDTEWSGPLEWSPSESHEVQVRVLGAVDIVGTEHPVEAGKPAEIVAYLATHPSGVDSDQLRTVLWPRQKTPAPKTFANAVSTARHRLGARHLPHATNERYRLAPTVTTDLARFESLVRSVGRQPGDDAIPTLRIALELVRGVPFSAVHGFHWAHPEGLVARAQALVVDIAHRMAELCLARGDPVEADWAAQQGLLVSPGNEALFRDRMVAADAAGNASGVEGVMDELCELIETGSPYGFLHPETLATSERLSRRNRVAG